MKENAHHFIGISIPSSIQTQLEKIQQELQLSQFYKKVTFLQDFHITLLFLGGWDIFLKEKLWDKLRNGSIDIPPLSLSLSEIGYFGNKDNPRVVWVGVEENQSLHDLQKLITSTAKELNFPIEKRPYRPHITLAKSASHHDNILFNDIEVKPFTWEVDAYTLFEVNPGQSPMYKTVSKIPLSG